MTESKKPSQPKDPQVTEVEILEDVPVSLRRPLTLIGEHAYAATWVSVRTTSYAPAPCDTSAICDAPTVTDQTQLVIVRDDGRLFTDAALLGARPLRDLELDVVLNHPVLPDRRWSGAGVKRYLNGARPSPADVFGQVVEVVDRFMDFSRSLADQRTMCELCACYVMATYFLDGFNVIGYLWPTGDRGTGKTRLLFVITEMAHLGLVVLAGGTYATLRDMADYGATLAFDDCENIMDARRVDPDKRALMLAGNRRGTHIPLKEAKGSREWVTRLVHAYCPRLFSAIRLPDDVLGSRTITVPLVRSLDDQRAKVDPLDHDTWPHDRQRLVDDLWALGLTHLKTVHEHDAKAADQSTLIGRDLDPWRGILAVALWLEETSGVDGLCGRMEALSVAYQEERGQLEVGDQTRLLIKALRDMLGAKDHLEFGTATLTEKINALAKDEDLGGDHFASFTNVKKVGRLLQRLRFKKGQRTSGQRRWLVTQNDVDVLAQSYGQGVRSPKTNDTHDILAPPGVSSCQVCQVSGGTEAAEQLAGAATQSLEALKQELHRMKHTEGDHSA